MSHAVKIGLLAGLVLVWVVVQWPDSRLKLVFCDVGQGDAQLIIKGSYQVLVDAGPSDGKIAACLGDSLPFWDREIELVVVTHPQSDHMGGLDEVLRRYKVNKIMANGVAGDGGEWEEMLRLVKEKRMEVFVPEAGDRIRFGGLEIEVLWPEEERGSDLAWSGERMEVLGAASEVNEMSIVMRLVYGQFTAMLTGDIGEEEELALMSKGVITPVDVLKVAHHGSKYSTSEVFVEAVKPALAVVQVGERNVYGHPSGIITKRFDMVGSKMLRTDRDGKVVVVSDGERWWVD